MADVRALFDPRTSTLTYVVWDPATRDAVIVDPVLDYDPVANRIWTESVDAVMAVVDAERLAVRRILETHVHADHLSGAQVLREKLGVGVTIGAHVTEVLEVFRAMFHRPDVPSDGSQFDALVSDGEIVEAGSLRIEVIHTPGHTPACVSYRIDDLVFVGDALFLPDAGTGRCDFPKGSATALYASVQRLYRLPDAVRLLVGHDYPPGGRAVRWETTVGESKSANVHLSAATPLEDFVRFRTERDRTLLLPKLIFQSVQVNIDAGRLPPPEANGTRYLKLPLTLP